MELGFLGITGVLMIVGGILSFVVGIWTIIAISADAITTFDTANMGILYVATMFKIVSGVLAFIAGVIAFLNCDNPDNAESCITWGIIVVVLFITGGVITTLSGNSLHLLSLLIGLAIPGLFIYGALQSKEIR